MLTVDLPNITDISRLDHALLTLTNTSKLVFNHIEQLEPKVCELANADDEERTQFESIIQQVQALSFVVQTISELTCHTYSLVCDQAKAVVTSANIQLIINGQVASIDNQINPLLQTTVLDTISVATDSTILLSNNLADFAATIKNRDIQSSNFSAIKTHLACLIPAFWVCYHAVSSTQSQESS